MPKLSSTRSARVTAVTLPVLASLSAPSLSAASGAADGDVAGFLGGFMHRPSFRLSKLHCIE